MKKIFVLLLLIGLGATPVLAEESNDASNEGIWEIESLVPMYFYDGYHAAVAYRRGNFRFRSSIIYSEEYNAEKAGIDNNSNSFNRYYDHGSCGVFVDYFIWKGLHVFAFLERHNWLIESKKSGDLNTMSTIDYGPGIGYQYFIGDRFYIQPGVHFYFRDDKSITVGDETYTIPKQDRSLVLRLGWRL